LHVSTPLEISGNKSRFWRIISQPDFATIARTISWKYAVPKTDVLPLLADGEFHSGQQLADVLGISRTAVWKQLKKLEELGLEVEASKASGYRLPGGIELLDAQKIQSGLGTSASPVLTRLWLDSAVDSTNAEAMRQLQQGPCAGLVCLAEQQTAGRGRRGRSWVSPFASNLYLSVVWEFEGGAASLEGLSLAVGVAVAQGLENCGAGGIELKWPNDLLHQGRKLGGILIEMVGDAAGSCQVVIGIGINVRMPRQAGEAIDQAWTDLSQIAPGLPHRNHLLVLVHELSFGRYLLLP
jgi:BirA family biotin operon repressor/biotin-[acetyl-CoA-carboxylase] ligase